MFYSSCILIDVYYKEKGFNDLKESTGKTVKGVVNSVKYTVHNASTTYQGIVSGDKTQTIQGLKNIGKVAAVSTLAIGVVVLLDGADLAEAQEIDTINDHLNGTEHPETGVPFEDKTVELPDGEVKEGVFPIFESKFSVELPEDYYLESDDVHFSIANYTLYQAILDNPSLANDLHLSQSDIEMFANGETPDGYVWHHNEEPGVLQLVDEDIHNHTAHTGGRFLWGGGSENR
ncbi:HNH endonuclease [Ureibacillus thermophilus]|uniref:HNH endonuclease n=1 Tax=Ureibacillus thermophilus TaxID=367743 RepID=A0A4P6UUS2_9BACL|nr:HNH endonuclease [Ureibacillus thermophilus]